MSLRKKQTMTQRKISANQANGKRSKGPATPQGRERIRAANIRHGFYSKAEGVALACLGEDPADLERLRQNLHDGLQFPSALKEELAEHLVQVVWRWNRAGRGQEGFALRLAKLANLTRENRLHAQMMRLKITAETLRRLAQSVAHEHYVTTPAHLEIMKSLHQEGVLQEMGEITLVLFYQLQVPGTGADGVDPDEKARRALARIKSIFGLSGDHPPTPKVASAFRRPEAGQQGAGATLESQQDAHANVGPGGTCPDEIGSPAHPDVAPDFNPANADMAPGVSAVHADLKVGATQPKENDQRYPSITAAEWEARERPRQLLENIPTRQVEICEAQRQAILKDSLAGPSPYERAAEIALAHPNAALMQRMEESSFRQIWRICNLLLKIRHQA